MKYLFNLIGLMFLMFFIFACQNATTTKSEDSGIDYTKGQSTVVDEESQKNILQIAISSKDHSTLVAAVQATELEDVLANNGPLTVFAPTNDAFDALPEGTLDELLKPENKKTLANIIWYHAAPGTYTGNRFKDGMSLYQASGDNVEIKKSEDGKVTVNGANILGTVAASNGVVHVVDAVLLPPGDG